MDNVHARREANFHLAGQNIHVDQAPRRSPKRCLHPSLPLVRSLEDVAAVGLLDSYVELLLQVLEDLIFELSANLGQIFLLQAASAQSGLVEKCFWLHFVRGLRACDG